MLGWGCACRALTWCKMASCGYSRAHPKGWAGYNTRRGYCTFPRVPAPLVCAAGPAESARGHLSVG